MELRFCLLFIFYQFVTILAWPQGSTSEFVCCPDPRDDTATHNDLEPEKIRQPKCYEQMKKCQLSNCTNCDSFINCCTEVCVLHSNAEPKFICEDEGKLIDCKCNSTCFDQSLGYHREASGLLDDIDWYEEFSDCCGFQCPSAGAPWLPPSRKLAETTYRTNALICLYLLVLHF